MKPRNPQAEDFIHAFRQTEKGKDLQEFTTEPKQTATKQTNDDHFKVSDHIEANNREDTTIPVWEEK